MLILVLVSPILSSWITAYGPAARLKVAQNVQAAGHLMGDMFEISTIRKKD